MLFLLSACLLVGAGAANAQVAPPALRINLAQTSKTGIGLIWTAVSGATGYVLQYSTNPQFTGAAQVGPISAAYYVVNGLASNTTYYFRGYSVAQPPSGWSSTLTASTFGTSPTPTPGLSPTPTSEQIRHDIMLGILNSGFGTATCGGVAATKMSAGQSLTSGQQIYSPNGQYRLRYQPDANLVLYLGNSSTVLWATNKYFGNPGKALMQPDGNFVTYNGSGAATWATATNGRTGAWLALQDDGNLVLYQGSCAAVWRR